jgi:DNA-binding NarL/FixJ family response regulator
MRRNIVLEGQASRLPAGKRAPGFEARYGALLVFSSPLEQERVRGMLEWSDVAVVMGTAYPEGAVEALRTLSPDLVVAGGEAGHTVLVDVARDASPRVQLLVVSACADKRLETDLLRLHATSFLLWQELTPMSLHWAIGSMLVAQLHIESEGIAQARARQEILPPDDGPLFTQRERVVLVGLAEGLSERVIAEREGLGLRTVERTAARLADRLRAADLHELRFKARSIGFGSQSIQPD